MVIHGMMNVNGMKKISECKNTYNQVRKVSLIMKIKKSVQF